MKRGSMREGRRRKVLMITKGRKMRGTDEALKEVMRRRREMERRRERRGAMAIESQERETGEEVEVMMNMIGEGLVREKVRAEKDQKRRKMLIEMRGQTRKVPMRAERGTRREMPGVIARKKEKTRNELINEGMTVVNEKGLMI